MKRVRSTTNSKKKCTLNNGPSSLPEVNLQNEYRVIHSKDETDKDTLSIYDQDVEDDIITYLIKSFGPTVDTSTQEEIQQVSDQQYYIQEVNI